MYCYINTTNKYYESGLGRRLLVNLELWLIDIDYSTKRGETSVLKTKPTQCISFSFIIIKKKPDAPCVHSKISNQF